MLDELNRLKRLYNDLSFQYRDLEKRVRQKTPRRLRRHFVAGAAVGFMLGLLIGTAIAKGH